MLLILVEEGHFPFQHRRQINGVDTLEAPGLNGVEYLNEPASDRGKGFLRSQPVLCQPGVCLTPDATTTRGLGFGVLTVVDAEFEGGATPDAAELIEPRFNPVDEGVVLVRVGVLFECHLADTLGRPCLKEAGPELATLRLAHAAPPLVVAKAPGQPPCWSMTSSISDMRRMVSFKATMIFW